MAIHAFLIIVVAFAAGLSAPEISDTIIYKNEIYKKVDPSTPVAVVVKPSFKERHPKIYKVYRGGRRVCMAAKPFLDVCAAAATIATPFAVRR